MQMSKTKVKAEEFIKFISHTSIENITMYLVNDFDKCPFSFGGDEPSNELLIQQALFSESSNDNAREKFRESTVKALKEKRKKFVNSSNEGLDGSVKYADVRKILHLAYLAALIGAKNVGIDLIKIIKSDALKALDEKNYIHAVGFLLGVLRGFLPSDSDQSQEIKKFFIEMFNDSELEPRFAGHLFLGICECEPSEYNKYVS